MAQADPSPDSRPPRVRPAAAWASLLGLMLAGAALRIWPIASRPLWHDEVMTWKAARTGLARIVTWQHHYEHPPLYYLLTWIGMKTFGDDAAWVLRLPAVICGIACIAAIYGLAAALAGRWAGLVAAAAVAFDLNAIIQSQQARMYTLTTLAVTLTLAAAARALRRPGWRRWTAVGAAMAAAFGASHMGLIVWAALPLGMLPWLGWRVRREKPGATGSATAAGAGAPAPRAIAIGLAVAFVTAAAWSSVGARSCSAAWTGSPPRPPGRRGTIDGWDC